MFVPERPGTVPARAKPVGSLRRAAAVRGNKVATGIGTHEGLHPNPLPKGEGTVRVVPFGQILKLSKEGRR